MSDEISEVYNTSEKKKLVKKNVHKSPRAQWAVFKLVLLDQRSQRSLDNHETVGFLLVSAR